MPTREKRLERARNNPKNVTFVELMSILESEGFDIRDGKGSHCIATYPGRAGGLTIARRNPVKRYIVLLALEAIDEVRSEEGE